MDSCVNDMNLWVPQQQEISFADEYYELLMENLVLCIQN